MKLTQKRWLFWKEKLVELSVLLADQAAILIAILIFSYLLFQKKNI